MNKKVFKKQDIEIAYWEEADESSPLVLFERMDWIGGGKFQQQKNIFQDTITKLYYSYIVVRSGSYFTEYNYSFEWEKDDIEMKQVIKTTETIEVWKAVS